MKKIFSIDMSIFIMTSIFTACSSSKIPQEQIIGQWQLVTTGNIQSYDFPTDNIYFYENGQMTANGENMTYSIVDQNLTIISLLNGTKVYEYTLDGDYLSLTRINVGDGIASDTTS